MGVSDKIANKFITDFLSIVLNEKIEEVLAIFKHDSDFDYFFIGKLTDSNFVSTLVCNNSINCFSSYYDTTRIKTIEEFDEAYFRSNVPMFCVEQVREFINNYKIKLNDQAAVRAANNKLLIQESYLDI